MYVQHWSKRTPLSQRETLWGGYVVRGQGLSFYFAGDTAYCPAFKQIGRVLGPFDLAAIPIGAYLPRNVFQHMHCDPAQAVQIHQVHLLDNIFLCRATNCTSSQNYQTRHQPWL